MDFNISEWFRDFRRRQVERSMLSRIRSYDRQIRDFEGSENGDKGTLISSLYQVRGREIRKYELFTGRKFKE
jgi:hypothetical protein